MALPLPIRFQEHLQLSKVGIKQASIKFSTVSFDTARFISVVQVEDEGTDLILIDLEEQGKVSRRRIRGEEALYNSGSGVVAVRQRLDKERTLVELFPAGLASRLKSYSTSSEVLFWKWVSPSILALVTHNSAFHWSLEGDSCPLRVLDRHPAMAGYQVTDYRAGPDLAWLVLVGLAAEKERVVGKLQLYSAEKHCSQIIEGHVACFARFRFAGATSESDLLCFTGAGRQTRLHVVELGLGARPAVSRNADLPNEPAGDFPVALQPGHKHGLLYVLTKLGYLYVHDLETATCIYTNRISAETVFATVPYDTAGGIIGVTRTGQVLSVAVEETRVVPYIRNVLQNRDLAMRFASRNGLPGAEDLFVEEFETLFGQKEYVGAARIVAVAPTGLLRSPQTMRRFQEASPLPGQISPLLQYFGTLLDHGQLNKSESLELCRPVLLQGKKELLEKWLMQNKLDCSEELGNLVRSVDRNLALSVYLRAAVPDKVVECFAEGGHLDKIMQYSEKADFRPDYVRLLKHVISTDPDKGLEFARALIKNGSPLVELQQIVSAFTERSLVQQCTAFLLGALKNTSAEESGLQTKLLEINLLYAPQVADAILGNQMYTYYDRLHVGRLCEKSGLVKRALEHFTDLEDIKRVIVRTDYLNPEWLVGYFGTLGVDDSIACLKELLDTGSKQNLNICLRVAIKYQQQLTINALVELFESLKSPEGLFCFLGSVISDCHEEEVHFKYIKAACELGQMGVVESVCRTSSNYCPEKVKNYLKEAKLTDYLPLVIVCDRFNFIKELVFFLHINKLQEYLEMLVNNVNPTRLPSVVGELLDIDCSEEYVTRLISEVRGPFSVEELVVEVEKRNRLYTLLPWLEGRVRQGCTQVSTHNALAKIWVDRIPNPEEFLKENHFYDSRVVGKYCEARNPHLACIAYERGRCDSELLNVFKENGMFKQTAKFLVGRKSPELWAEVLRDDTPFRRSLLDQVIHSTLLESRDPLEVSETVKGFMAADLLTPLIHLLDKLMSENPMFSEEPNLQNLSILTAMKVDKPRVMEFIERFNHYAAEEIANIALNSELYSEALAIYKKFNMNDSAMQVIMTYLDDFEMGHEFAEECKETAVWNILGRSQLKRGLIKEAIASFLKAGNPSCCEEVVNAAQGKGMWEDLTEFLQMAVKKSKDPFSEEELIYAYAKTGRLRELEEYMSVPNNADINKIGERCFRSRLFKAAKLLFNNSSNFSSLALTQINLNDFQGAVENSRKANKIQTWKEVCFACLGHGEFRFAQLCALHIAIDAEELETLIAYYEEKGYFEDLISVLEIGLSQERAHMGMFTHLAILYAKYRPDKMKDHLETFWSRMNIPKAVRAAEEAHLWPELVLLHDKYEHYDKALAVMMERPTEAWKESYFNEIILKVSNHQLHLKAVRFYLEFKPLLLNNFLTILAPKLDNPKAVRYLSEEGRLGLVKPYLRSVQHLNDKAINEAVNDILISEEDYRGLKASLDSFDNLDVAGTARRLERHRLAEMRKLAVLLHRRRRSWGESIQLCLENGLYREAMETAAESSCRKTAEGLLAWFLDRDMEDCFLATLLSCYQLLRPDVVLEMAWRAGATDLVVPFFLQLLREYVGKVDALLAPPTSDGQSTVNQPATDSSN